VITVDTPRPSEFPVLDFKFQNTGNAAAVLWKFTLLVDEAKVDPTPEIFGQISAIGDNDVYRRRGSGMPSVAYRRLTTEIRNNGWGPALSGVFTISNPILDSLISEEIRTSRVDIPSGDCLTAGIDFGHIDVQALDGIHAGLATGGNDRRNNRRSRDPWSADDDTLVVGKILVRYEARDEWGRVHNGVRDLSIHGGDWVGLNRRGFVIGEYPPVMASVMPPDTVYCCILDPDLGTHEREYSISRQVGPGDAERFQIVVGCVKSAHLRIRLRFHVDKLDIVESQQFLVEISNPRNARYHNYFVDGDVARAESSSPSSRSRAQMMRWSSRGDDEERLKSFPFVPE
jgi:hypothetical protein